MFENLAAFGMDEFRWSRKKSCLIFGIALAFFSMPCILGFSIWSHIHPLGGQSSILDFEDFIVSENLLPLGALFLTIFSTLRYGWGCKNLYTELNTGKGLKFPFAIRGYLQWGLPLLIFVIWVIGIVKRFC